MIVEKAAIVSGAGSGIGRATALQLAAKGYHVGVLGRARSELDETCDLISKAGGRSSVVVADVSDSAEMHQAVGKFVASKGRLDAVVANAGINGVWAPIDDLKPDDWNKTIAVNLTGTYLTIHHCVPT